MISRQLTTAEIAGLRALVRGNETKISEFMSDDEENEMIQTMQYIQCKSDESIQDNNEARSLVS